MNKIMEKINLKQWKSVGIRQENSVLNRDVYTLAFSKKFIEKMTGLHHQCKNLLFVNSEVFIFEKEYREFSSLIVEQSIKNPKYLYSINTKLKNSCNKLKKYSGWLKNQRIKESKTYLSKLFNEALDKFTDLISYSYLLHNQEEIPNRIINSILIKCKIKRKDLNLVKQKLLVPLLKRTLFQQEVFELKQIAQEIRKRSYRLNCLPLYIENKIEKHIKKYDWINSKYFNIKKVSYEEIIERIKTLIKTSKSKNKSIYIHQQNEFKHLAQKLQLSKNDLLLINLVRDQLYYKTLRKELIALFSCSVKKLFEKIAEKEKITYLEFINQTVTEINTFFNFGKVNRSELTKRIKGFDYLLIDGKVKILSEPNLIVENTLLVSKISILKGIIGNIGRIRAKVRIVSNIEEAKNIKKGEIIASPFVSPEFNRYAHLAEGIITDKGGILSHAVLVAREQNIPCIVGTKNATQVLRTGDLVDFDAYKGKVRIIEKRK